MGLERIFRVLKESFNEMDYILVDAWNKPEGLLEISVLNAK